LAYKSLLDATLSILQLNLAHMCHHTLHSLHCETNANSNQMAPVVFLPHLIIRWYKWW